MECYLYEDYYQNVYKYEELLREVKCFSSIGSRAGNTY